MSRLLLVAPWAILLAASLYPALESKPPATNSPEIAPPAKADLVRRGLPTEDENSDRRTRREEFVELEKSWLAELHSRRITLATHVDRVMMHCLTRYPEHLENLDMLEEGIRLREKVARNVLRVCEKSDAATQFQLEAAVREIAGQR